MSPHPKSKSFFRWKGFTSLTLTIGFTMLAVSGIILYLTPRGRVANWTGWEIWGLTKDQWAGMHMGASLLILVVAGLHLFFNWKVLWHYVRTKRGFNLKLEMAAALGLSVLFLLSAIYGFPPVSTLEGWNQRIKDHWETPAQEAPVPHAEELPLSAFATELDIPLATVREKLAAGGFVVPDEDATVAEIAERNETTPEALLRVLRRSPTGRKGQAGHGEGGGSGSGTRGLGRMTLGEFCDAAGVDPEDALERLAARGAIATVDDSFRDLASSLELSPRELETTLTAESPHDPADD